MYRRTAAEVVPATLAIGFSVVRLRLTILRLAFFLVLAASIAACDGQQNADVGSKEPAAPPTFVGSAACSGCHAQQVSEWQGSHHDLAMQVADEQSVLGNFADTSFEYFGDSTRFSRRDGKFIVRTGDGDGQVRDFPIRYTFGVEPLQQYLVEFPHGRLQVLPFAWDTRPGGQGGQRWFHLYPHEMIGSHDPLFWTGREQNWNYMCAECHSTQVELGYDAEGDSFATSWQELDVACEACHGPGSLHVEQAAGNTFDPRYGLALDLDDRDGATWQMQKETGIARRSEPRTAPPRQPEACGRCHSRRGVIAAEYEFGKPLTDTHSPSLLVEPLYFPDGQIRDEVYVYGSFLQSRMYRAGVTCSNCHNPHSLKLVGGARPNDVCAQCHLPAKFATTNHQRHAAETVGCIDCHMPERTYMQVDARHDHSFRIPRPDLTGETGAPNACNDCHDERDAAWAATRIEEWYGAEVFERPEFATAFAAARAGHANDALRRVVRSSGQPGIARATALTLLDHPVSDDDLEIIGSSVSDPDPLLRIAAHRALRELAPEVRGRFGFAGLSDPVRGVRMAAALAFAEQHDLLSAGDAASFRAAAEDFRRAHEHTANRPESAAQVADFELAMGNMQRAIDGYQAVLAMAPESVAARVNLADLHRANGDEATAERILRDGLARDGDNAPLQHSLGLLLARTGRPEESLAALREAAQLAPADSRFAYVLGVALNSMGKADEAVEQLERARRRFPADFDIAWALATMYRDRGDVQQALYVAGELLERHPGQPNVVALHRLLSARDE